MVLPFPYRLITAWINNPGPNPLDGPSLEVVEAPWTCQSRPDMGPDLSKMWVQLGGCLPLVMAVKAWQYTGFSPRLLHCGSNDHLDECVVEWFDARVALEERLEHFEFVLQFIKYNLEHLGDILPMTFVDYITVHLMGLRDLNTRSGGIRDQEIRGMYLVLSKAARGCELLSGPEERISIVKQFTYLFEGLMVTETGEQSTGVRLVDRSNTLVREFERVLTWARGGDRHGTTPTAATTTTNIS